MAILNRLPTKDRMSEWGMQLDRGCVLCHNVKESRNHIFFGCSFSKGIWKEVLSLCHLDRGVLDWEQELKWAVQRLKGKAMISSLLKVAWNAYIYNIWRERNIRIHDQKEEILYRH